MSETAPQLSGLTPGGTCRERPVPTARPHFKDERAMPIRLDRLLAFIEWYRKNHNGNSPTVRVMANEMDATESAINFWLRRLEDDKKIMIIGRAPLRIALHTSTKDLTTARRIDDALKGSRLGWEKTPGEKKADYEELDARRIALASFIGRYNNENGRGPTLREMMQFVGSSNANLVDGMLLNLKDRGLVNIIPTIGIDEQPGRNVTLTEIGKMTIDTKKRPPRTPEHKASASSALELAHVARRAQGDARLALLHGWAVGFAEKNGRGPTYKELAAFEGHAPASQASAIQRMKQRGLLGTSTRVAARTPGIPLNVFLNGKLVAPEASEPVGLGKLGRPKKPVEGGRKPRHKPAEPGRRRAPKSVGARKLAAFILTYWEKYGDAPMQFEMAEGIGLSPVHYVEYMIEHGWATRNERKHRSIRLTPRGEAIAREELGLGAPEAPAAERPPITAAPTLEEEMEMAEAMPPKLLDPIDPTAALRREMEDLKQQLAEQRKTAPAEPRRDYLPEPMRLRPVELDLRAVSDVDLLLEMQSRGYTVRRV